MSVSRRGVLVCLSVYLSSPVSIVLPQHNLRVILQIGMWGTLATTSLVKYYDPVGLGVEILTNNKSIHNDDEDDRSVTIQGTRLLIKPHFYGASCKVMRTG